jgi:hypothetical protein
MNTTVFFCAGIFFLLFATRQCFGSPEFVGVLASSGATYVAMRADPASSVTWVPIGGSVGEYRVVSYDPRREVIVLLRGRTEIEVPLKSASVQSASTLALLQDLVRNGDVGLISSLESLRMLDARRNTTAAELADLIARAASDPSLNERVSDARKRLRIEESNLERFYQALASTVRDKAERKAR